MSSIIIRRLRNSDKEKLVELMRIADYRPKEWSLPRVEKYLKKKDCTFFLGVKEKELVGYVGVSEVENDDDSVRKLLDGKIDSYGCINWIAVHPNYRGQDIASKLLLAAEEWLKRRKKLGVWLDCRAEVIPLYRKNNYSIAGKYSGKSKSGNSVTKYVFVKEI